MYKKKSKDDTHIIPEKIVLQSPSRVQPNPLFRVIVSQKEAV